MDTDHPVFRTDAPEYDDPPADILIERIAARWSGHRDLGRQEALAIVRDEAVKMLAERPEAGPSAAGKIIALLAYIVDSATPLAELDVVAYCYGLLGRGEESMDSIARRHAISRQAFSKKVQHAQAQLGVDPRGGMRPAAQRRIYQDVHVQRWDLIHRFRPRSACK
jgi:hypothetical protein